MVGLLASLLAALPTSASIRLIHSLHPFYFHFRFLTRYTFFCLVIRAGLQRFDKLLDVDGQSLESAIASFLPTKPESLDHIVQYQQRPVFRIERPPKARWQEILAEEIVPEYNADEAWIGAILGCSTGDEDLVMNCMHQMMNQGKRPLEKHVGEMDAVLAVLYATASGVDCTVMSDIGLVEIALDKNHGELAQLLLTMLSGDVVDPWMVGGSGSGGGGSAGGSGGSSGGSMDTRFRL